MSRMTPRSASDVEARVRGAELVTDLRPVDAVEGRVEVRVVHDLPDAIEGLDARFLAAAARA